MNDLDRVVTRNYQPTDDDIIRARLRTLGVQEYHFVFEYGGYASGLAAYTSSRLSSRPFYRAGMAVIRRRRSKKQCMNHVPRPYPPSVFLVLINFFHASSEPHGTPTSMMVITLFFHFFLHTFLISIYLCVTADGIIFLACVFLSFLLRHLTLLILIYLFHRPGTL